MTLQATTCPTVRPHLRRQAYSPVRGRLIARSRSLALAVAVDRLLGALGLLLVLSLVAGAVMFVALPAGDLLSAVCPSGIDACLQAWREGLTPVAAFSR